MLTDRYWLLWALPLISCLTTIAYCRVHDEDSLDWMLIHPMLAAVTGMVFWCARAYLSWGKHDAAAFALARTVAR